MSENKDEFEMLVNSITETVRNRMLYATGGMSGNTKRTNIWEEFGYPRNPTFRDYYSAYDRNAVAHAAVHRTLDDCWSDNPTIVEGEPRNENKVDTAWEKQVTKLLKRYWAKIKDADRRNLVGHYSALIIQVSDNKDWNEPVDVSEVKKTKDGALKNLIPVWEQQLTVSEWDSDQRSPNYGKPKMYNFDERPIGSDEIQGPVKSLRIHPDRVIILCEGSEDDNILSGVPLLKAGYNKLLDLEKTSGGSAEGFLKNASRQISIEFDAATEMEHISKLAKDAGYKDLGEAMSDKVNKLNRGTDSAAVMQAGKMNVLAVTPGDPTPTWTVTANEFSASIRCPFTILFGQQTGRLASSEDKEDWANRCNGRRWGFQTQYVTNLIERLWAIGVIDPPKGGEVTLVWSDKLAPSEKDKIENMKAMADVADKTRSAFGTPAVTENEVRAVGELDPIKISDEPTGADESAKSQKDPLIGEEDGNTTTTQSGDTSQQV